MKHLKLFEEYDNTNKLLNIINSFFKKSMNKKYLFQSEETKGIDGINLFNIEEGTVVGIDEEGVILEDQTEISYNNLNIEELNNVISCYIEPIEKEEIEIKKIK
jgi:hypothetical protein